MSDLDFKVYGISNSKLKSLNFFCLTRISALQNPNGRYIIIRRRQYATVIYTEAHCEALNYPHMYASRDRHVLSLASGV